MENSDTTNAEAPRAARSRLEPLFDIDTWGVNVPDAEAAVSAIFGQLELGSTFLVCTLNLDHLVKLRCDREFRKAYSQAAIVTADGFPIVLAGRMQGVSVVRTPGADLIEPLCEEAATRKIPVFLLGSSPGALFRSARVLHARYGGLDIRGVASPPAEFAIGSRASDELVAQIKASGARICFVALGAPKQELFATYAMEKVEGVCFLGIGGGLDFIAQVQRRAPVLVRRLNLEWLWRLLSDPGRLGMRYARCALLFFELAPHLIWKRVGWHGKSPSAIGPEPRPWLSE